MSVSPAIGAGSPRIIGEKLSVRFTIPPFTRRLLSEPLLHFLIIGIALFGVYAFMHRGRPGVESSRQIALALDDLRQMDAYFQSQWHRQPTAEEFRALVEDKVREEVLYREGLAMGLDKDDTIVKRRMAQKVQFLTEDVAAAHEPTTAQLEEWFHRNSEKFALPGRFSFRHLYFSADRRGQTARDDAQNLLARLAGQQENVKLQTSLGDRFMFQDYYTDRTSQEMAKEFGPTFALAVEKLKPGSWQGPVESGYGWHLVFVDSVVPGRIPAFEEIESEVKTAWLGYQKQKAWSEAYTQMRGKYTVLLPAPPDSPSPTPPPATQKNKDVPASSGEGLAL